MPANTAGTIKGQVTVVRKQKSWLQVSKKLPLILSVSDNCDNKSSGLSSKARRSNTNLNKPISPPLKCEIRSRSTTSISQKETLLEIWKENPSRKALGRSFDPFKYVEKRKRNKVAPVPPVTTTRKSCQCSVQCVTSVDKRMIPLQTLSSQTRKSPFNSSFTQNTTGPKTSLKSRPKSAVPVHDLHSKNGCKNVQVSTTAPSTLQSDRQSYHGFTEGLMADFKTNRESRAKMREDPVDGTTKAAVRGAASLGHETYVATDAMRMAPFSFQARNREFQRKKDQKIKSLVSEEERKLRMQMVFQARPVPSLKQPMLPVRNAREATTKPRPFSFEERDKRLAKKKEESIRNVMVRDEITRTFHARPAPDFGSAYNALRPVTSKENVHSGVNKILRKSVEKPHGSLIPLISARTDRENRNPQATINNSSKNCKTNNAITGIKSKGTMTKVLGEYHLNSLSRTKDRNEFDERIKRKEHEMEFLRKKTEGQGSEIEMRKMAEKINKVRPMPVCKPQAIVTRFGKPSTGPQNVAWAIRNQSIERK